MSAKNQHGAYILARYSTDRQNPDSIEVQVQKCSRWCSEQGLPILDIFPDMAISGMKDERPQYNRMMGAACRRRRGYGCDLRSEPYVP